MFPSIAVVSLFAALSPLACAMTGVQVLGLLAAGLVRLAEGTRHERICQWLLLVALAAVGSLCGFALQFGAAAGAVCAITLTLMTMICVIDVRPA